MIEALISSKTRIKLLLKFFLNSKTTSYLRGLEAEFGESSNAIRIELNRFEKAGGAPYNLNVAIALRTTHILVRATHLLLILFGK